MRKLFTIVLSLVAFIGISVSTANAKTLKCQTVLNTKADEVKMLKDFTDTVTTLTDGSLKFEILPAGAVVGVKETLDAVDKGLTIHINLNKIILFFYSCIKIINSRVSKKLCCS